MLVEKCDELHCALTKSDPARSMSPGGGRGGGVQGRSFMLPIHQVLLEGN